MKTKKEMKFKSTMKKVLTAGMCIAILFSFAACNDKGNGDADSDANSIPSANSEIPNPFRTFDSLDDALKEVGYDISIPDEINGGKPNVFRVSDDDMLDIIYEDGENETARIRKMPANEENGDISGDYNEYADVQTVNVGDLSVTMKGNDGKIILAIWQTKDYSYALSVAEGADSDQMSALISAIA